MSKYHSAKGPIVSLRYFLIVSGILTLACLLIVILFKEIHEYHVLLNQHNIFQFPDPVSDFLIELFKTVFVGICMGLLVELSLRSLGNRSAEATLKIIGVVKIYPNREDASEAFEHLIADTRRVKSVSISGISLREFLTEQGPMRPVWRAIQERLKTEETENEVRPIDPKQRFTVNLMLLDPRSSEGFFRYEVEESHSIDNPKDIEDGLAEVKLVQRKIYGNNQPFLNVKLYEHCPFSFIFLTERKAFVEQYYYKHDSNSTTFPLIEYASDSPHFIEIQKSLQIIWEHAYADMPAVGTAMSLKSAGIKNIFRWNKREQQAKRQIECINAVNAGNVDILTITGRHYVDDPAAVGALRGAAQKPEISVRFALLNPISQQAIFRAISDISVTDRIRTLLADYDWKAHQDSKLYHRVHETMGAIRNWVEEGVSVEVRLYSCAASSAFLLTPDSAFVGKYVYGRSKELQGQAELRSEYPMIEFVAPESQTTNKTELEILECTFKVIWDYYSISAEDFRQRNKEDEFNKNLNALREELGW